MVSRSLHGSEKLLGNEGPEVLGADDRVVRVREPVSRRIIQKRYKSH